MSFLKTLATLAIGVAAAKGYDRFRKGGGMAGLDATLRGAGEAGGLADQMGKLVEKMGLSGGAQTVRDMTAEMAPKVADAGKAAEAGFGAAVSAVQGTMVAGAGMMSDLFQSVTGAAGGAAMSEEGAKLMIRAMIQAARADGELDADEKARIMGHLGASSLEERAFVEAEMAAPLDMAGLAAAGAAMKEQVYSASLMAINVDNAAEVAYLRGLAAALGLSDAARDAIHVKLGLSPLAA